MYVYDIDYTNYEYVDVVAPIQKLSDVQMVGVLYADLQASGLSTAALGVTALVSAF